jgi:truncated hemoglobin YjbI
LFYRKGKMEKIDYTKLNERIVEQAYEAVLNKEQLQKLIQDKLERARQYHEALVKSPTFSVN